MSLFGLLKSGPDAAQKVLEAGVRGLDALVFTPEEQSAARQKLADNWLELQKALGEETTVRSVTRRILAVLIVVPFVLLVLAAAAAFPFYPEYARFLLDLAQSQFGLLVLGVAGFYFGPYMLRRGK